MSGVTHKNKYKRRGTYKVHRGGFFGRTQAPAQASAEAAAKAQLDAETKHTKLGDERLGVLLSTSSLQSEKPQYKAAPYVIIIPKKFNGDVTGYAYGVSAADAVKAAGNKKFTTRGFEGNDTYTGVAISASRLLSPNKVERTTPYVIDLGPGSVRVGSSPQQVTATGYVASFKRGYTQAKKAVRSAADYATRDVAIEAANERERQLREQLKAAKERSPLEP